MLTRIIWFVVLYSCLHIVKTKNIKSVSRYLTACSNDDECYDFRLICDEDKKICNCTSYYAWNDITTECMLQSDDLKKWLIDQSVEGDKEDDRNSEKVEKLFYIQACAGITAIVSLCIVSMVICFLAFCEFKKKEEKEKLLKKEEKDEIKIPTTSQM